MEESQQDPPEPGPITYSAPSSSSTTSLLSPPLTPSISSPPILSPASIADLPIEIIELIFDFYFENGMSELPENSRQLTYICRTWTRPVQRHLFKRAVGGSPVQIHRLRRFIQRETDLAIRVKSLKLFLTEVRSEGGVGVSVPELNRLVGALPNLTTLTLELEFRWTGGYSGLAKMPTIETLSLKSDWFDKDLEACRSILNATPNLTSLSLIPGSRVIDNSMTSNVDPIELPLLKHLELGNAKLCPNVRNRRLSILSDATLGGIDSLGLNLRDSFNNPYSALPLLWMVGDHITKLTLGKGEDTEGQRKDTEVLRACPNLQVLIATNPIHLIFFPPLMERIIYQGYFAEDLKWWTKPPVNRGVGVSQLPADWQGVKTVEFELKKVGWDGMWSRGYPVPWEDRWEIVIESFVGRDVEVLLNGEFSSVDFPVFATPLTFGPQQEKSLIWRRTWSDTYWRPLT